MDTATLFSNLAVAYGHLRVVEALVNIDWQRLLAAKDVALAQHRYPPEPYAAAALHNKVETLIRTLTELLDQDWTIIAQAEEELRASVADR